MKITKAEARQLEKLVGKELREATRTFKLNTVADLKRVAEENDLRTWKTLFSLEQRLRSESVNPENEEGLS
jgi:hypothetical protein